MGIHPECKIFQQVVKEEALCLEKNESVSPDLKGNGPDCQALARISLVYHFKDTMSRYHLFS